MSARLEAASKVAYAMLGTDAKEYVALGFEIDDGADSIVWYPLTNVAGVGEFLVEDDEVRAVLSSFQNSPENALLQSIVLWHSHYLAVEPSDADVSNFPSWVDTGMVFHAPSGRTSLYNAAGIIRITDTGSAALATPEVAHG